LLVALQKLSELPIPTASKQQLSNILQAASNPVAERIDVVVASLPQERRANVERTSKAIARVTSGVTSRGRDGILTLTDEEWEKLVNGRE
jgi:hypothetical protein